MKESTALPTLDELRETTTFTAMAEWLTACPLALFVSHGHEIRAICEETDFEAGAAYTAALTAVLHRTRKASRSLHWNDDRGGTWMQVNFSAKGGKADRPSGDVARPAGAPASEGCDAAREAGQ